MLHAPDNEGKYPMTGKEYTALLRIFATETALVETEPVLRDRLRTIPNGWRDFKMIIRRLGDLSSDILDTVPLKKLFQIQREVKAVRVKLSIGPDASCKDDQVIYINEKAFIALLDQVVQYNCLLCDKHGREVKKCPWLKLIEDAMPYSPDPSLDPADGSCQLAGRATIIEDSEE